MKVSASNFVSKTAQVTSKKSTTKAFKEDEKLKQNNDQDNLKLDKKIGIKAIRKILRTLCDEYSKDEMQLMIWVSFLNKFNKLNFRKLMKISTVLFQIMNF
jgi:hypothetical protein